MKTVEQAKAERKAVMQEIRRAFAPLCAWYYPPGRAAHNIEWKQAPATNLRAIANIMSRRWLEAEANLNTALDQQAQ